MPAFKLVNNIDIPETEAIIAKNRAENAAIIALNQQKEEAYAVELREREEMERKEREQRAAELRREENEERAEKEKDRRALIDKLETSDKDAWKVVAKSKANALKRSEAKATTSSAMTDYAKLLKARTTKVNIPDEPHIPLQDDYYAYDDMFILRSNGYDDWMSEDGTGKAG